MNQLPSKMNLALALMLSTTLLGIGCSGGDAPSSSAKPLTKTLPDSFVLSTAPTGAQTIEQLKADAKEGQEVVIQAVVGGREKPFVSGRAIMTVVDAGFKNQCKLPGDSCKTPWDYCCAGSEDLGKHAATVQFVGADGKPLSIDLSVDPRTQPLATLTITGKIGVRADTKSLVIHATGIHTQGAKP